MLEICFTFHGNLCLELIILTTELYSIHEIEKQLFGFGSQVMGNENGLFT